MPRMTNSTPNSGKMPGAPIDAAAMVQKMPKMTAMTEPMAPMADGPRPGLTLFMAVYLLPQN